MPTTAKSMTVNQWVNIHPIWLRFFPVYFDAEGAMVQNKFYVKDILGDNDNAVLSCDHEHFKCYRISYLYIIFRFIY